MQLWIMMLLVWDQAKDSIEISLDHNGKDISVGGIKKLNVQNYDIWQTCMESYLQRQDL